MVNKIIVLDNSCAVKPILNEAGKQKINKIFYLKEKFQLSIFVPELFRYEFLNIISREKGTEEADIALKRFSARQVSFMPYDRELNNLALTLTKKYKNITFYDATYHALAKLHGTFFLTADKKYFNLTKAEGDVKLLDDFKI